MQMAKGAGLQQIEKGDPVAGKHDQIGFHQATEHFDTISGFAGFLFIDGPDNVAGFGMKFVSFKNDFMIGVFFIGQSSQVKIAQMIDHYIKAGWALVTEQHGSGCRLVGEQFAVAQKFGPSGDGGIAEARENVVMQPGCLRQVLDQTRDHRALSDGKGRIDMIECIIGSSPAGSSVMGGGKGQPVDGAHGGQLPAQRRLVKKIALPGTFAAGAQGIFIHAGVTQVTLNLCCPLPQDLLNGTVNVGPFDTWPERKRPPVVKGAKTVSMAGQV